MSPRRLSDRIQDILDAINEVDAFTRGMDLVDLPQLVKPLLDMLAATPRDSP